MYGNLRVWIPLNYPVGDKARVFHRIVYTTSCTRDEADKELHHFLSLNPGMPVSRATWTVEEHLDVPMVVRNNKYSVSAA